MKTFLLSLVGILTLSVGYCNTNIPKDIQEAAKNYVVEEEVFVPFNFNHKDYLPVGFNPSKEFYESFIKDIKWVDEDSVDQPFDFDYKQYLPVGFNPSKAFYDSYLKDIKWVDEDNIDEPFDFDTKAIFVKYLKEKNKTRQL